MQFNLAIDASRSDPHQVSGTERYSYEIIRSLIDIEDRPAIMLYRRSSASHATEQTNVSSTVIDRNRLWTHLGLSRAMVQERPDVLFVPSHVIPLAHPAATVVTVHDLGYIAMRTAHPLRQIAQLELTTRWNTRAATEIIAISEQTKCDLMQHYGVDENRIHVIHHGVDRDLFRPVEPVEVSETRSKLNLVRPYILFVSTIQPRKNLERLVDAFERLDWPDLDLVIAGRAGWQSAPILRRIAFSPHTERIRVLGHVADEDLPALYNGAELFVLPSLYEGFGMGVVEAMACGCPVLTSSVSSLPEVGGDAVEYVDPYDVESIAMGLRRALEGSRRRELIERGFDRVSRFTWERAASETLAVIERAHNATITRS